MLFDFWCSFPGFLFYWIDSFWFVRVKGLVFHIMLWIRFVIEVGTDEFLLGSELQWHYQFLILKGICGQNCRNIHSIVFRKNLEKSSTYHKSFRNRLEPTKNKLIFGLHHRLYNEFLLVSLFPNPFSVLIRAEIVCSYVEVFFVACWLKR